MAVTRNEQENPEAFPLPGSPSIPTDPAGETPPFFRTWRAWYTLVLTQLLLTIAGLYFFTRFFE